MTSTTAGARIPVDGLANLRDVGGWPVQGGGQVRRGLAYRSASLDALGDGGAALADLGIHTVYDMRTAAERGEKPDVVPPGIRHVVLDVLADSTGSAPAQILHVLGDPDAAAALLGEGRAAAMFEHGYREIVSLPSALAAYRQFFHDLAVPEPRPVLFHCTTGKDRTGWAAAVLLMLLGVSEADVRRDYLLTNQELRPMVQPMYGAFQAAGGDPELLRPVLGVEPAYLRAALDEMRTHFGTVEAYFAQGLGIDDRAQATLRHAFVEPALARTE